MKKKNIIALLSVVLITVLLSASLAGCNATGKDVIHNIQQLNQSKYTLSADAGSAAANTAVQQFPNANIVYTNSVNDAYLAVQQGKSDAFVYGRLYMQYAIASEALSDLTIMDDTLDTADIAAGIAPGRTELLKEVNDFIRIIKADGTFDDMYNRWVVNADDTMPDIEKPENPDRSLKFATSGLVVPMNYIDENQEVTGFDVEFMRRLALYLNADITIQTMSFDALVASLETSKIDLVVSDLNVTPERKEVILMSDPYMTSDTAVLVRKDRLSIDDSEINSIKEINGKKIGIAEGSSYDVDIRKIYPNSEILYYPSYADLILALQSGKIDTYISDEPIARYQVVQTDGIKYFEELLTHDDYAFVVAKENVELQQKINKAFGELKAEGVFDELINKWLEPSGSHEMEINQNAPAPNGVLKVITSADQEPFAYVQDEEIVGYDIEIIYRVAEKLGYSIELTNANFSAVFPSITTGKSDVAIGCITITPERAESVSFTVPVYNSGTVAIILDRSQESKSFISKVVESFNRTFIRENRWKLIVNGLVVTIELSIISAILGTFLGFLYSFMLRSRNKLLSGISGAVSTFLDGMPLLVVLMILYYIVFNKTSLSPVIIGIFGFSIDFANVVAGLLNTGVKAVDAGQLEAASSMGYKKWQIFTKITFPQAARQMFSQYNGAIVGLIKGTAVIGYIAVQDLTKVSDIIRSRTYEAFFPLIATAVIYFIFARIVVAILQQVGKKLDPKRRKRVVKGVRISD